MVMVFSYGDGFSILTSWQMIRVTWVAGEERTEAAPVSVPCMKRSRAAPLRFHTWPRPPKQLNHHDNQHLFMLKWLLPAGQLNSQEPSSQVELTTTSKASSVLLASHFVSLLHIYRRAHTLSTTVMARVSHSRIQLQSSLTLILLPCVDLPLLGCGLVTGWDGVEKGLTLGVKKVAIVLTRREL